MENTLENKAKFFALYWGQKAARSPFWNDKIPPGRNHPELALNFENKFYLELIPLSQITDEDALKAYRFHWSPESFEDIEEANKIDTPVAVEWLKNYGKPKYIKLTIEGSDYLRSKGYALPFLGISVDQQIEWGWIRLNTQY